jgi:hypothetical protein
MEDLHKIILTKNLRKNIKWKHLINSNSYLMIPNNIIKIKLCLEIEKHLKIEKLLKKGKHFEYIDYYADDEEYYDEIFDLKTK